MSRVPARAGSGALIGIAAIGVVVMATLVLTQGYLSGAINLTDAVLAGRKAEYLADAAAREAFAKLQAQRNADPSMFLSGGGTSIDPVETRALASDGVQIDPVQVSVTQGGDFHGDGRGTYGSVDLVAVARVPRRVARALGTAAYRSVKLGFEFKAVQQGAPAPFAAWPLYVTSLRSLPRTKDWYDTKIKGEWDRVRDKTIDEVKKDADEVVRAYADFLQFVAKARDLLIYAKAWPDMLSDPVGGRAEWDLQPKIDINGTIGSPKLTKVRLYWDRVGEAWLDCSFPCNSEWRSEDGNPPAVRPKLKERVEKVVRESVGQYLGVNTIDEGITLLSSVAAVSADEFYGASQSNPSPIPAFVWREFRTDGANLTSAAHVEAGNLQHQELILKPPAVPNFSSLSSPLKDVPANFRSFDRQTWFDEILGRWPGTSPPFLELPTAWTDLFDPYQALWTTELQRYQDLIKLDTGADENLLGYDYWAKMAAYAFPDSGTMAGWIGSHGGRAGAVYRFPAGSVDLSGLPGDATFAAQSALTVQGSSDGMKNAVSGGSLNVGGAVRAALLAKAQAVEFGGATVTGMVATAGLRNAGLEELEPFTIAHEDLSGGSVTISICEYPNRVLLDRGE